MSVGDVYADVGNDPLNGVDPFGLSSIFLRVGQAASSHTR